MKWCSLFYFSGARERSRHMGFREPIRRLTLSDANEARDWRIHADFAQALIRQARKLYAAERTSETLPVSLQQRKRKGLERHYPDVR